MNLSPASHSVCSTSILRCGHSMVYSISARACVLPTKEIIHHVDTHTPTHSNIYTYMSERVRLENASLWRPQAHTHTHRNQILTAFSQQWFMWYLPNQSETTYSIQSVSTCTWTKSDSNNNRRGAAVVQIVRRGCGRTLNRSNRNNSAKVLQQWCRTDTPKC